jgi:hypothetical protein
LGRIGKIMIKKITWPSIFFGPINLWNCPRQSELDLINLDRNEVIQTRAIANSYVRHADDVEGIIKEREFLYYLHSGRFPE